MLMSKSNLFIKVNSPNLTNIIKMTSYCIFCKIIARTEPADILFEDEDLVIFKDIKPAAKTHILVVPKVHIKDPSLLKPKDTELVVKLINAGKHFLESNGSNVDDTITGFHWPPFNSVKHLHLHVINPASEMGFISRTIFRPNTWWFATDEYVLKKLSEATTNSHL